MFYLSRGQTCLQRSYLFGYVAVSTTKKSILPQRIDISIKPFTVRIIDNNKIQTNLGSVIGIGNLHKEDRILVCKVLFNFNQGSIIFWRTIKPNEPFTFFIEKKDRMNMKTMKNRRRNKNPVKSFFLNIR